ncbi:MAG TPA: XrtB/PEP-CTERM-associated polysaccharide biosynthesis outer membrane protein EpsL [Methylotenera sp.]|nr:XrtB/PEP-CTERM-associated polysaccharide biosynthesis outer membrane protein EpsL [Methylotenera sp.]
MKSNWVRKLLPMTVINTLLLSNFFTSIALADSDDTFNFNVGTSYQHDSNLFRLPDGVQPTGDGAERSDNISKTNLGFKIDKDYSLQTFKFDYVHQIVRFENADFLNFNANNYNAAWLWALTPSLKGNLSSSRTEDLVPFIDFNNSDTQNIRTTKTQIFDFDWSPHNVWHLLGGYTNLDVTNSQTFLPETSYKFDALEGGIKYSFPSDSYVALKFRNRNGSQDANNPSLISSGFTENEEELSAYWIVTGKSKVGANFGYNKREDDSFAIRDFSGYFGGIEYVWNATSKLDLNINLSRKLAAFQDTTSSYTVNDVLSIRPTWAPTSKTLVKANVQIGKRKFLGDGPVVSAIDREDDFFSYGIGADWSPRSTIKLSINLQHEQRNSNFSAKDYSANIATINGQLTF